MKKQIYPEDVIINRPARMRLSHRLTNFSLTILIWGLALWLLQSLLTLVGWYFQGTLVYHHLVQYDGWLRVLAHLFVCLCLCTALLAWARLQELRFRGKERRVRSTDATGAELALFFGVDSEDRLAWLGERRLLARTEEGQEEGSERLVLRPDQTPHPEEVA